MLAKATYDFRDVLQQQGIIFCYSGYVTEPVLSGIGEALKKKLELDEADKTTMRNIFAIFVEQMQNIVRYSAEREPPDAPDDEDVNELRYGVVTIGSENGKFFVTCGNKIFRHDVDRLSTRLSDLKAMDAGELKALYKEKLRAPQEATSKGAGLGFIEIARRSSEIIDFDFMDLDDEYAFFCLKAHV